MTVTITSKNAYINDCSSVTGWTETRSNMIDADTTFVTDGDVFGFTGVLDSLIEQEYFYEELDLTNFSTTLYPYLTVRFKTGSLSNGMEAYVQVVYDDASTSSFVLGYSGTWKVTTCTLTAGKNVDKIRLFADEGQIDSPNGTYYVYYDWFMFHHKTFTFPHLAPGGVSVQYPMKLSSIPIGGRHGDIQQWGGMGSPEIVLKGDMLPGESWSEDSIQNIDYILRGLLIDKWAYFTCDYPLIKAQVVYKNFYIAVEAYGSEAKQVWILELKLHKLNPYDSSFGDYEWMYSA